jgi:hypothetical protein
MKSKRVRRPKLPATDVADIEELVGLLEIDYQ